MKNSIVYAIGATLAVATRSHAAPARTIVPKGAVSFTAKPQKFAVWLPTKPQQFQQTAKSKSGVKVTAFGFVADGKPISYLIVAASLAGTAKGEMGDLNVEQKSFLNSSGGTLQKREELRQGGFSGRELLVKLPIDRTARVRIFITPKFHYILMAQAEPAAAKKQKAQIDRFFDSFRISPQ